MTAAAKFTTIGIRRSTTALLEHGLPPNESLVEGGQFFSRTFGVPPQYLGGPSQRNMVDPVGPQAPPTLHRFA